MKLISKQHIGNTIRLITETVYFFNLIRRIKVYRSYKKLTSTNREWREEFSKKIVSSRLHTILDEYNNREDV